MTVSAPGYQENVVENYKALDRLAQRRYTEWSKGKGYTVAWSELEKRIDAIENNTQKYIVATEDNAEKIKQFSDDGGSKAVIKILESCGISNRYEYLRRLVFFNRIGECHEKALQALNQNQDTPAHKHKVASEAWEQMIQYARKIFPEYKDLNNQQLGRELPSICANFPDFGAPSGESVFHTGQALKHLEKQSHRKVSALPEGLRVPALR